MFNRKKLDKVFYDYLKSSTFRRRTYTFRAAIIKLIKIAYILPVKFFQFNFTIKLSMFCD